MPGHAAWILDLLPLLIYVTTNTVFYCFTGWKLGKNLAFSKHPHTTISCCQLHSAIRSSPLPSTFLIACHPTLTQYQTSNVITKYSYAEFSCGKHSNELCDRWHAKKRSKCTLNSSTLFLCVSTAVQLEAVNSHRLTPLPPLLKWQTCLRIRQLSYVECDCDQHVHGTGVSVTTLNAFVTWHVCESSSLSYHCWSQLWVV